MRYLQEQLYPSTSALNQLVSHAHRRNPFYRRKLGEAGIQPVKVHRIEDLAALPYTTREELQADPWMLLASPKDSLVQAHISTGTSGRQPVYVVYDWEDLFKRGLMPLVAEAPHANLVRIGAGEIVFNAVPYEVSVTGLAIHRALQDGVGACVVPVGKGGFYSDPDKTLKMMREIRGDHLFTTPSYAVFLAEQAARLNVTPACELGLRSVWLIGELCSPALRRRIEALWGCPAFKYYGSMECGPIGVECQMQDGYHLATNFVCVEIDAEKNPSVAAPVDGEIVATQLWRYASPLIRYRTGDIGHFDSTPCSCGIPGARVHVRGRKEDCLEVAGKTLYVADLENVLLDIPEISSWFQVKVQAGSLRVYTTPVETRSGSAVADAVYSAVREHFGVDSDVEFIPKADYTGGKFLRVIREDTRSGS